MVCNNHTWHYVSPRLESCSLTEKSCAALASAARSTPCSLKTLNLSRNYDLHDAGIQHLSDLLNSHRHTYTNPAQHTHIYTPVQHTHTHTHTNTHTKRN